MCVKIMFGTHFYFCLSLRNIAKPFELFYRNYAEQIENFCWCNFLSLFYELINLYKDK